MRMLVRCVGCAEISLVCSAISCVLLSYLGSISPCLLTAFFLVILPGAVIGLPFASCELCQHQFAECTIKCVNFPMVKCPNPPPHQDTCLCLAAPWLPYLICRVAGDRNGICSAFANSLSICQISQGILLCSATLPI